MTQIFVPPEELADFHQQIVGEIPPDLHLIAKDEEFESCLYLSDEDGMPVITATLHGVEVERRDAFEDSDDLYGQATSMYAVYVGNDDPNYRVIDAEDEEDEEDLVGLYGKDYDECMDAIDEFEDDYATLLEEVIDFLCGIDELRDLKAYSATIYHSMMESVEDAVCTVLADYGLSVRRPMIMCDASGKEYIEEFPYACG